MTNTTQLSEETGNLPRRSVLSGIALTLGSAGCMDALTGDQGPQERSFEVRITAEDDELDGDVSGDETVNGLIQVFVGDTVTFTYNNETDDPVGVHDHPTDEEAVIDGGGETTFEYEVIEAMVGRHEIEAWVAGDSDDAHAHEGEASTLVTIEVRPEGS